MDNSTVIVNNSSAPLKNPHGIALLGIDTDSIIFADASNNRVLGLWNVGTVNQNISVVATQWAPGQSLSGPYDLYIDVKNGNNLYLSDYNGYQVIQYINMQSVSPPPSVVAGSGHTAGSTLKYLESPYGVQVDSQRNVIVADRANHRVMFWPPNATNGTLLVGLGRIDNSSMGLNYPSGIALDELNSFLYVADTRNHRIQRYSLNGTWPCNGTTVAGGNGAGSGSNQLNQPNYIRLSNKTGAMYIVDYANSRIQRWQQGATSGVTIAGNPYGYAGSNAIMLSFPIGLAINANETQMYVTDATNSRIQRFQLI
jgi:DNA-binding beta-propeller fold protein YncE